MQLSHIVDGQNSLVLALILSQQISN